MMNTKSLAILLVILAVLGGVYYYLGGQGKIVTLSKNATITTQEKTNIVKPMVYVKYSECYPNGPDTEQLLGQEISFSHPNPSEINIEFYDRMYSKITNLTATVNKTTLQFQGPVYLITVKEYTDESQDVNQYAKCVRKVTIQLVNYPLEGVNGVKLEWYKMWRGEARLARTYYHRI